VPDVEDFMTSADIKWDREHPVLKGTTFGALKVGGKNRTVCKWAFGQWSIQIGNEEYDFDTEVEFNNFIQSQ
jgi:hypothetical protein